MRPAAWALTRQQQQRHLVMHRDHLSVASNVCCLRVGELLAIMLSIVSHATYHSHTLLPDRVLTFSRHACSRPLRRTAEEGVEESIFHQAFIPRQLHDVVDFERVHDRMAMGGAGAHGVYYDTISGMMADQPREDIAKQHLDSDSRQDAASVGSDCSSSDGNITTAAAPQPHSTLSVGTAARSSTAGTAEQQPQIATRLSKPAISAAADDDDDQRSVGTADDGSSEGEAEHRSSVTVTKEDRKSHKKAVKEAARERRKTKIPKHVKKRATKHK